MAASSPSSAPRVKLAMRLAADRRSPPGRGILPAMRKAICLLVLVTSLSTARAAPMTVDDVVAKNLAAHGGEAKLHALGSRQLVGKARFGTGDGTVEVDWAEIRARGAVRMEITLQGLTQVTGYDGREGWSMNPFQGRRESERMSADDAKGVAIEAELGGPLLDWRGKGHKVELLGTEDVDGTLAIKLRVTRKGGDVQYLFLDPDSYLEIRTAVVTTIRGVEQTSETDLGDYEQVAGVWLPFSLESGDHGAPRSSRITVAHAEPNLAVDGRLFKPASAMARALLPPAAIAPATPAKLPPPDHDAVFDAGAISGIGMRNIGSATMSGRVAAVAARVEGGKTTVYAGAASGGVWKSLDGGTTFKPVFDKMPVQSIGAIAIDPSNARTIWVGTGEAWTRNSVSIGDGIYRSTDAGETWTHLGLPESERIVRILVHPRDGNTVYVCVPGKLWSDSKDRGVYKTTDGGASWSQILAGTNLSTGCSGLAMDPKNPDTLLAGMWDFRRKGWTFRSGGDGPDAPSASGMYRTVDGGKHWSSITANKGLPAGPWGRVEVEFAPSDNRVVYALVEGKASSLFRSSDGGATWEARDHSQMMVWRPFYFARLVIDPTNPNRLFKPDLGLVVSEDGGNSFSGSGGGSHGDWHDLWIDPTNPRHVIGGDDGGLWTSHDGGNRWWKSNNLPISQFYHVSVDAEDPYQVYGGLQDNSSWVGPSAYPGGITNGRWENINGGDGFWAIVDPTDPGAIYAESQGGYLARIDRKTLASRDIQPKANYHEKLRFNWNTPVHASPTRKGTIYIGGQFLFRSRDRGDSWERISPDLTTNDPTKQQQEKSGGVTIDNSSAEMHTTIYAISESPKDANLIWVGTDDGNLQITRNGGGAWTNVIANVPDLPPASWVSWVEASRFEAGTAYVAFDRHTYGDMAPWVYRTGDFGKTWTRIVSPDKGVRGYVHAIKEDTVAKALLYVGTELGLWISVDGGTTWAALKPGNFPAVAVREIAIQPREDDLVLATHGRGIWIVDDLRALRALSAKTLQQQTAFLPARPTQQRMPAGGGWAEGDASYAGENPAGGAVISYYLRTRHVYGPIVLEILDAAGKLVDTIAPTKRRGINRVTWSMQVAPPRVPRAAQIAGSAIAGPRIVPGTYKLRLTRGTEVIETALEVAIDRRAPYKAPDRKAQFEAAMRAHALFGTMSALVDKLDGLRAAVADRTAAVPAADALGGKLRTLAGRLDEIKKLVVATTEGGAITGEERIREHLDILYGAMLRWEGRPTKYQLARIDTLDREIADVAKQLAEVVAKDVRALDSARQQHKLAPIPVAAAAVPAVDQAAIECVASRGRSCGRDAGVAAERD